MPDISYQLYCSRNFPPLIDTLRMLSNAGYREIEGYGGLYSDLDTLKDGIDQTGLHLSSGHFGVDMLENDVNAALNVARYFKMRGVYGPHLQPDERPTDAAGWTAFGARLQEMSKPFLDAGFKFGWHNHAFELEPISSGELPLDLMIAAAPDVSLELDIGWVFRAGLDPVATIEKYAGRISAAHIKDLAPEGENADEDGWADVGHGILDWPAITAALQATGTTHYVIEHDNPADHFRFATRSLATLKAL
ncbi:MAG: sugar phosphate isomerase/epimerase [Pseudomonadota bacterium]